MRNAHDILIEKLEGKNPSGRPWCRQDDIKMDFKEIGCEGVNWIHLTQYRDQWWASMNIINTLRSQN